MKKPIKIIGFFATIIGIGTSLLSDWVNEKKMEEEIEEKINDKFTKWLEEHENNDEES